MRRLFCSPLLAVAVGLISVLLYAATFILTSGVIASPLPSLRAEILLRTGFGQALFLIGSVATYFLLTAAFAVLAWGRSARTSGVLLASYWLVLTVIPYPITETYLRLGAQSLEWLNWLATACFCVGVGGWLATMSAAAVPRSRKASRYDWILPAAASLAYVAVFGGLATLQYETLNVPHGDSGMYEEHLWNLWSGKGFRSQIDSGRLFLGEHFQVFHVLLMPIYLIYPSLVTLNLCESAALASGSIAVFLLARRMGLAGAAWPLSLAYLLYFPLQYLNLEASWKTFRPETFGAPLVLWGLLAIESGRWRTSIVLFALSLTAKEDYAVSVASIGCWLIARGVHSRLTQWSTNEDATGRPAPPVRTGPRNSDLWLGLGLTVGSALFLWWVLEWFIPHFRGGVPHYTAYFRDLGDSPSTVFRRMIDDPAILADRLLTPANGTFLLLMLLPLGFVPWLSPTRFLVAVPTFGYLMLSSLDALSQPWFHFHAPLIPVLFWATVGGVRRCRAWVSPSWLGRFVCALCFVTGVIFGRSPASWKFYDPLFGTPTKEWRGERLFEPLGEYWRDLYVPGDRVQAFDEVLSAVKPSDRVAATDYVRNRFTHYRAAYEYPIAKPHFTIDDVDVIVIDRKEGWWGREPNNPDRSLLNAVAEVGRAPKEIEVKGRPFRVVVDNPYFLVLRQVREGKVSDEVEAPS